MSNFITKNRRRIAGAVKFLIHLMVLISILITAALPVSLVAAYSHEEPSSLKHGSSSIPEKGSIGQSTSSTSLIPHQEMQFKWEQSLHKKDHLSSTGYFIDGPYSLTINASAIQVGNKRYAYISIPYVYDASLRAMVFDWSGYQQGGLASCQDANSCNKNPLWSGSSPFYSNYGNRMCIGNETACNSVVGQGQWLGTGRPFDVIGSHSVDTGGSGAFFSECTTSGCPNINWDVQINNIYLIYYGTIPEYLQHRTRLSSNQPKNGLGDPRECAISACGDASAAAGDPVDTRSGNFDYSLTDLSLQTIAGPLSFQRSYASLATDTNTYPTDLSPGWSHNHDTRLIFEGNTVWFKAHTLNQYRFTDTGGQTYTPTPGVLANLVYNLGNSSYTLTSADQSVYTFNSSGQLQSWRNELGYGFDYTYGSGKLYRVSEALSGRYLQFNYQNSRLSSVNDHTSRQVTFSYNSSGDLSAYIDARGETWGYAYGGSSHRMNTLTDPNGETLLSNAYDAQGRVYEQFNGKGERIVKLTFNVNGSTTLQDALGRESVDGYDSRQTNSYQTDSAGYTIYKTYDDNFRPSTVIDQDGRSLQYEWSADGANLLYVSDAAGYETHLAYDAANHLTGVIDPQGQETEYIYDDALLTESIFYSTEWGEISSSYSYTTASDAPQPPGMLKSSTDDLGRTSSFTYDGLGQLQTVTNPNNETTIFTYDNLGQLTHITDALGRVTKTVYDPAGNITDVIRNFDSARTQNEGNVYNLTDSFIYDDLGRLTQHANTLGFTTTYSYDEAGRIWQVSDAYDNPTTTVYNAAGQISSVSGPLSHSTGYEYDSAGRLWKVKDALNQVILTYAYNTDSTLHSQTQPTPLGNYVTTYETYDALKRPTVVSDNDGHFYENAYNAFGNPLAFMDAFGQVTRYEYNELGLLSAVTQNFKEYPDPQDDPNATNIRTEYSYDALGNLKKVRDANGHETSYDYDVLDRLWKVTNPLGKVQESLYGTYSQGGQTLHRITQLDPNGNTTLYNFDLAERLHITDYPGTSQDVTFSYDPLGRLTDMQDGLGSTGWVYDNLNRVTFITDPFDKTVGYTYDAEGKRSSITYPAPVSKTISYQYNSLDQLKTVLDGSTQLAEYDYDTAGRLSGVSLANGLNSVLDYSLSGQLTNLSHHQNGIQLVGYVYRYNALGQRDQVHETLFDPYLTFLPSVFKEPTQELLQGMRDGLLESSETGYPPPLPEALEKTEAPQSEGMETYPPPPVDEEQTSFLRQAWDFLVALFSVSQTVSASYNLQSGYPPPPEPDEPPLPDEQIIDYVYDPLGRLVEAAYSSGTIYEYEYDPVGNRTAQVVDSVSIAYQYDAADRLTSAGGTAFTWDDNGNLLSDGVYNYAYDAANRLLTASGQGLSYGFVYDGLGNRYQQTMGGQTSTYTLVQAGSLSQVLYDGEFSFYYGLGRISQQQGGNSEYFLTDALGSIRQIANSNGTLIYRQSFDPFGNLIGSVGNGGSSYGYAGEWTDGTGLQHLRARYYAPQQGRFTSTDPFPGMLSQPATLNPYSYVVNNPVQLTDPSGEIAPILIAAGLGGLVGAGIDIGVQLYNMRPSSLGQALRCMNWGKVGISFASGAIAGLTGFITFSGITAIMGTGFLANVAAGAVSGVMAGQHGRATGLLLSGQANQISGTLFRPQDMILDAILGGVGGAIGYGIQHGLSGIAEDLFQGLTDTANRRLGSNPGLAQGVLSKAEYMAGQANPSVAPMQYGNAIERMVAQQINNSPLKYFYKHVGGPNNPDFLGSGVFNGLQFDTTTPGSVTAHLSRPYGQGLIMILYNRPPSFKVFP